MESPNTQLRFIAVILVAVLCWLTSSATADASATLGQPSKFVAPDWMLRDRPELAKALVGVKVYKDIEYVPGASKQPLATPSKIDPQGLAYIKAGGNTRAFDLYLPAKLNAHMPVVVWLHGGPNRGTKEGWCPALVLLTQGYIVVSANYRLRGEAPFPAVINDDKAAIRWLRAHADEYHIDRDHIGIWGHSAGAWQAAWMGIANDAPSLEGNEGNFWYSSSVQAACVWAGGALAVTDKGNTPLKILNPKKSAPFLIMHGTKDKAVPFSCDEILAQALVKSGVECTFIPVPGAGHGIGGPALEKQVIAFFDRHLKPGSDAGLIETKDLPR